jgi:hypothetical protein
LHSTKFELVINVPTAARSDRSQVSDWSSARPAKDVNAQGEQRDFATAQSFTAA